MAQVQFTQHLRRFFPDLVPVEIEAETVAGVIAALDRLHPGLACYLVDDRGALRRHVNVFVESEPVRDREALSDPVGPESQVFILQALSGG